jgi:hypothetical protein
MSEEFSFTGWLTEGAKGTRKAFRIPRGKLLPTEFHEHMKSSRKELLLAFRSLFDVAIQKVDAPKSTAHRKTTKIKVE